MTHGGRKLLPSRGTICSVHPLTRPKKCRAGRSELSRLLSGGLFLDFSRRIWQSWAAYQAGPRPRASGSISGWYSASGLAGRNRTSGLMSPSRALLQLAIVPFDTSIVEVFNGCFFVDRQNVLPGGSGANSVLENPQRSGFWMCSRPQCQKQLPFPG